MSASYSYEVFVPEKSHFALGEEEKVIDRPAKLIAAQIGVYPMPTVQGLLNKYAAELTGAGIDFGTVSEVMVTIRPFLAD
jgi:hypothetical protein